MLNFAFGRLPEIRLETIYKSGSWFLSSKVTTLLPGSRDLPWMPRLSFIISLWNCYISGVLGPAKADIFILTLGLACGVYI
jgi:hypothetical protein